MYVTFSLVIYGNLDGVYVSKGMTTCISVHKDVLFASHTVACSSSPGHTYYIQLSFHIPNLIFSSHSHLFPHQPPALSFTHFFLTFMLFWWKTKGKILFFIILASLCSLLLVYINIVLICVIESAHKSNTNVVLWGSFSFLITAIVCTLYTISTFTFSFPSSALNRHCSLSLCAQSFEKYEKKNISKYTCKEKKKNDEKHAILSFA